jgi:hypothetical protein
MHDYLRAVGFSQIRHKRELQRLLDMVMGCPDRDFASDNGSGLRYAEKSKDFTSQAGITVRGELDNRGMFAYEYYFPHYTGRQVSLTEDVSLEKLAEREEYDGVCDNVNLGVSLIFHMNHLVDDQGQFEKIRKIRHASVRLSALSVSGTVLLPVAKTESQRLQRRKENDVRNGMIAAARQGDQEALENLTMEDIDLYTSISKRVKKEDVLTIVESYFMPYGIACDQYSVMGEIMDVQETYNQLTGEKLYQMLLVCNEMLIDMCINSEDLLGEPAAGRRFRGNIWLQGQLDVL